MKESALKKLEDIEITYLQSFTKGYKREWGYLFLNEDHPTYYDANHARVTNDPSNPEQVVEEVTAFYRSKNIIPRFYIPDAKKLPALTKALLEKQYQIEYLDEIVQKWNGTLVEALEMKEIKVEKVNDDTYKYALDIECTIKEFGGREVREKAFCEEYSHPNYTYYLLTYKGVPCSTACIFQTGKDARLEHVATLSEYRGKGLVGHLIHHIQREVKKLGLDTLWTIPINEQVENVYLKYGFETFRKGQMGHAFLGGKSIQEIRES
ncbi:GNAT superfamily N-acetyltransferase [Salirhabdus euzebyi]|uniref:GNAT superfamily N-acetyltransferase n=1 Tax=Salirhabdus euzebyi TaxID=394506 RepID=A0A841Q1Y7_9BACI|nr:GNAT family N-acetyltransferase [Salirhabdus euzebyi]MBB6452332.1 GNAT superfamily N-acetyltransferase [Salirhabdus euzebyi]